MSKIDIRQPHQLSTDAARTEVDRIAARMREKFGVDGQWQGDVLRFSRPGMNGSITVAPDQIHVQAELGLLLSALRSTIEQEIRRKLEEDFG